MMDPLRMKMCASRILYREGDIAAGLQFSAHTDDSEGISDLYVHKLLRGFQTEEARVFFGESEQEMTIAFPPYPPETVRIEEGSDWNVLRDLFSDFEKWRRGEEVPDHRLLHALRIIGSDTFTFRIATVEYHKLQARSRSESQQTFIWQVSELSG